MNLPIGVDEAGRGAIAGPVVAASFPFIEVPDIPIKDSKKIGEAEREKIFDSLLDKGVIFGVGVVSNDFIDSKGIVSATFEAMRLSILPFLYKERIEVDESFTLLSLKEFLKKGLELDRNYSVFFPIRVFISNILILVDGISIFTEKVPLISIIDGDERIPIISFASVVAKVLRDRIMRNLSKKFKEYLWDKNKGYGTEDHFKAIEKYGLTVYHRRSFLNKR